MSSPRTNKRPRESSPSQSQRPPRPSRKYPPKGADFCVVSSDGVAFGFTENQFRQSAVFNDMVALGAEKSDVHLVDPEIETSFSVELLLDILAGKRFGDLDPTFVEIDYSAFQCEKWGPCLLFAKKYEFTQAFSMGVTTCNALLYKCVMDDGTSEYNHIALVVFAVAARIDEEQLAAAAVQCMTRQSDNEDELYTSSVRNHVDDKDGGLRANLPHLDTGSWPMDIFTIVPSPYLWALGRAAQPCTARSSSSSAERSSWRSEQFYSDDVSERFEWFLKLAKDQLRTP